ncbi:MAG: type II CRISPR RNA-guided endonuclease Cas9, partial [Candidatus Cloacimonas sp.]
ELWSYLEEISFIPKDQDERKVLIDQNPYYLRSKGLDEELSIYEFARAIIHLSKRRGFKSNRKDLAKEKKTKLTDALENLKEGLSESGSRTIGEFLYYKQKGVKEHKRSSVRFNYDEKETDKELIFPTRALIEDEFNQLFDTQAKYHRELTDKVREMLYDIIFYQRPLKAQTVGKCYFESDEFRASKASPAFQEFRLWQEINNLKLINKNTFDELELTAEQKIKLFNELSKVREKTFTAMRRSILGRDQAEQFEFNFEGRSRSGFKGNETNHLFRANKLLDFWEEINEDRKEEVVSLIINSELEDEEVKSRLLNMELPTLTEGQIEDLININFPDGYGRLSVRAIRNILPHLREGMIYSEACTAAGYNHSDDYTGEVFTDGDLPYYGAVLDKEVIELQRKTHDKDADDYGKINNPTVHIALNQLRQLVNALSKRYGAPEQIVIELAREIKHSEKKRKEIDDIIKKNTKENERIAEELDRLGIANNYDNRTLYKLWEELSSNPLERRCVYSGKQINVEDLFNIHNPKFEVEHILPKSRTFDDSFANKTISSREANRVKGERSPYEAFGSNSGEYSWDEILERAGNLPKNKRWRFQPNAMKRFDDESEVLARMLNDTRYMSRVAKKYMNFVSGKNNVWVVTGKLTSDLRRLWGFNSILSDDNIVDIKAKKERADHRHHAIDAFVIAMTSRSFVQRYSTTIKRSKDRFIEQLEKPYSDFSHESFRERVENIVVSYKPDQPNPHKLRSRNQTAGELTLDTTFNFYEEDENDSSRAWYTIRKPIADIKHKDVENIISDRFRDELTALSEGLSEKELTDKLTEWGKKNNVKKLKVKQRFSKKGMIPVLDQEG